MSIFQKHCPECAAPNASDTISCKCGYCFDPEALAGADPSAYANQQDHLYRDYLAARIAQAEAEMIVAREQANAEPGSTYKASSALLAEQSLNTLQAELRQLALRISAAPPMRRSSVVAKPIAAPPPVSTPVRIAPVARMPTPLTLKAATPATTPKAMAPPAARSKVSPARAIASKPPTTRTKWPGWRNALKAALPRKAPTAPMAIESKAKAAVVQHAAPVSRKAAAPLPRKAAPLSAKPAAPAKRVEVAAPVNGERGPATPSVTRQPDESFRRLQSQRADAITRAKTSPAAAKPAPSMSQPATQTPSADIPPLVLLKQTPMQECPNCTASVAADLTRCTCGYVLSSPGEEVPAVALDATALAILTEGISFFSSNRRR